MKTKCLVVLFITLASFTTTAQNTWENLGQSGISIGQSTYTSLAMDSNNVPYIAYSDYFNADKLTVMKFNGTSWEVVGNAGFSVGKAEYISLAIDSNNIPYVGYREEGLDSSYKATVMKFNGTTWEVVGNASFSAGPVKYTSLAIDNNNVPYLGYSDKLNSDKLTVMKFNGTAWELVGNAGFSVGKAEHISLAIDSNNIPYVGYQEEGLDYSYKATVMKFNGTTWEVVGNASFSAGPVNYTSLAIDNNNVPYLGFAIRDAELILVIATVMKFNGTTWEVVGNAGFSAGEVSYTSLAIDSNNVLYLGYKDRFNSGNASVMKFNGTAWELVGNAGFSAGEITYTSLAIDSNNVPYLGYSDEANSSKSTVMKIRTIPEINTTTATNISKHSIDFGGSISTNSGYAITERGVVYATTNTQPKIGALGVSKKAIVTSDDTFLAPVNNLTQGTVYYYRAYATNSFGTAYGEVKSISTHSNTAIISTTTATNVLATTANLGGTVLDEGDSSVTERGIVYSSTQTTPRIGDANATKVPIGSGLGVFTKNITGLTANTRYYYCAYATNKQGTVYGAVKKIKYNNALHFSGTSNDKVIISDDAAFNFDTGFTFETWVKPIGSTSSLIQLFKQYEAGQYAFYLVVDNDYPNFYLSTDGSSMRPVFSSIKIPVDAWTHLACTFDGTTAKIYVNGILVGKNAIAGTLFNSTAPIVLKDRVIPVPIDIDMSMDEVRIWTRALTQEEIVAQKDGELPAGNLPGLVAYYKMNQGVTDGNNTAITTLTDSGPNGLDATLEGFTLNTAGESNFVTGVTSTFNSGAMASNIFNTTGAYSNSANWSLGFVPTQIDKAIIGTGKNVTIDVDDLSIDNFELENNATLSIPKDKEITVNNFSSSGNLELLSDATNSGVLYVKGSTTGTVTYKRGGLLANKWSIITPPVAGQKIKAFADDANNNIRTSGNKYAIGYYDDSQPDGQKWVYYTTDIDADSEFEVGKSYAISRATDGAVSFTGFLATTTQNQTLTSDQWHAIGNPYTTYYPANKNGNSSFLDDNFAALDDTYKGVYLWDNNQNKYIAVTQVDATDRSLPPGLGFFARLKAGQTKMVFNQDKRQTQPNLGNSLFAKTASNPSITLAIDDGKHQVTTHVKYFDNATLGFDPGYDIGNFNGAGFDIFTRLVNPVNATNFTIQSLPKEDYENTVIPIGITAEAGKTITFTATSENLPDNLQLFLEDKSNNRFTQLDKTNAVYTTTLVSDTNNIGRFYLHTRTGKVLDVDKVTNKKLQIFISKNRRLKIIGTNKLFNIQLIDLFGRTVFVAKNSNDVQIPKQFKGSVYIVKVQNEQNQLIKKIFIE